MSRAAGTVAADGTDVAVPSIDRTLQYYEQNALSYAQMTNALSMAPELSRFIEMLRPGDRVLDAGCGAGRDLLALRQAGMTAIGLDLSPSLATIARSHSGCEVVVGDLRDPPFEDSSFEGLWAAASLLHLTRTEIPHVLDRLQRLLVPGGSFFASVKAGPAPGQEADDERHFTYFEPDEWRTLLEAAGFSIVSVSHEASKTGSHDGWVQSLACA